MATVAGLGRAQALTAGGKGWAIITIPLI